MKSEQNKEGEFEQIKISDYKLNDDYFNFALHDIELPPIEKSFHDKVQNDELENLQNEFSNFITFLKESIAQVPYPYLTNAYDIFFEKTKNDTQRKYLLLITLVHQNEIFEIIQKFYHNLITSKQFDISPEIKKRFRFPMCDSKEYGIFTSYLSTWHSHSEIMMLYLWLLNSTYKTKFIFDKKTFSYQTYYRYILVFALKNIFKLASYLVGNISLNENIDPLKVESILLFFLTTGTNLSSLLFFCPAATAMATLGVIGFNVIIQEIAFRLEGDSFFMEIIVLEELIQRLDNKLQKLINYERTLMKLYLKKEILNDEGQGLPMSIDEAVKLLQKKIKNYLKDVNYGDDKKKILEEKMNELMHQYESNQIEGDWTMISLKKDKSS